MNYRQYEVTEELQPFIKCFWSLEAPASVAGEKQRIVPDGCMEMIFHYGDLYRQFFEDGSNIIQPRCFVFGQITSPLEIAPTGVSGIIAARFHPDGFAPFASLPVNEMTNKAVALNLFFENADSFEKDVLIAPGNESRIKIIETFLLDRLYSTETADRISKSSVEILLSCNGNVSVDELARQLNINRRQLERKFSAIIGVSPRQLSKVIRLQSTLKMLEQKKFSSLTSLAYENGYYDQAHFIKDFREFTGVSPKEFYAGQLQMSALFAGAE
jgi:AraC-like DNA-binding protein